MSTTPTFSASSLPSITSSVLNLARAISNTITLTSITSQTTIIKAIQQTLINISNIITAFEISALLKQEASQLSSLDITKVGLSTSDTLLVVNRQSTINLIVNTIYPLPLWLVFNTDNLLQGLPAITSYDLVTYLANFNSELIPAGLTINNFQSNAVQVANVWQQTSDYLRVNSSASSSSAFNAVDRMAQSSLEVSNQLNNISLNSNVNLLQSWNSLVAIPAVLRVASILITDPSLRLTQQLTSLKLLIGVLLKITNSLLSSFSVPKSNPAPALAVLRSGESLLDFAARATGDYTNWRKIAQINGLVPPYVGITISPGIATPGQNLFLPTTNSKDVLVPYDNILGTDIDLGRGLPLNTWLGEFGVIGGFNNLTTSLQRRVLTPIGSLVYHPTYGSRLPAEIGNISTAAEALLITAFLKSALLADPRVQSITNIQAIAADLGQVLLTAAVAPIGNTTRTGQVNLVLVPRKN